MPSPLFLVRFVFAGLLLASAALANAEPSIEDIHKAATSGNLGQAEAMMGEVLRAHPGSAKAHFIHAELLAKEDRLTDARAELNRAEQLQPGLGSIKPAAVAHLKQKLYPNGSPKASQGGSSLLLWGGLLVLVLVIVVAVRAFSRRPAYNPAYGSQAYPGQNPPMPGNPGYYPPQGGSLGSGIMGGLATGAAIGAGVVAGEALMRNVLGDHEGGEEPNRFSNQPAPDNYDMGGNDFGVNDTSSWDDGGSSWGDTSGDSGDWS